MELHEVYDEIAEDWSNKHQRPHPPEIMNIKHWKGKILDLGCGNCNNLALFKDSELYGIDFSEKMIDEAKMFCMKNKIKVIRRIPLFVFIKIGELVNVYYQTVDFFYIHRIILIFPRSKLMI